MANYESWVRSNYFKVKSLNLWSLFVKKWGIDSINNEERRKEGDEVLVGFMADSMPTSCYDEEKGAYEEGDFIAELGAQLADEWVAVIREIGHEKMRYLIGYSVAVNAKGEQRAVNIDDIYEAAKELGKNITGCEY